MLMHCWLGIVSLVWETSTRFWNLATTTKSLFTFGFFSVYPLQIPRRKSQISNQQIFFFGKNQHIVSLWAWDSDISNSCQISGTMYPRHVRARHLRITPKNNWQEQGQVGAALDVGLTWISLSSSLISTQIWQSSFTKSNVEWVSENEETSDPQRLGTMSITYHSLFSSQPKRIFKSTREI